MHQLVLGVIASALLFGIVSTYLFVSHNKYKQAFISDPIHGIDFAEIIQRRQTVFTYSVFIALIAGLLVWMTVASTEQSSTMKALWAGTAALVTQYFVYSLWPKTEHMLQYTNETQTKLWLQMYQDYQSKYKWGMLAGIVVYAIGYYFLMYRRKSSEQMVESKQDVLDEIM